MSRLAIVGAGSWGTALAIALASRFASVTLWTRTEASALEINATRENRRYLPGFPLPVQVEVSNDLSETLKGAGVVLMVVPSRYLRNVASTGSRVPGTPCALDQRDERNRRGNAFENVGGALERAGRPAAAPAAVLSGPTSRKKWLRVSRPRSWSVAKTVRSPRTCNSAFPPPIFGFTPAKT